MYLKPESRKILSLEAQISAYWNFLDIPDSLQLTQQATKYLKRVYRGRQWDFKLEFYLNPSLTVGGHYQRYVSDVQEVFGRLDTLADRVVFNSYGLSMDYYFKLGTDWAIGLGVTGGRSDFNHNSRLNRQKVNVSGTGATLAMRVVGYYRIYENWELLASGSITSGLIVNPTVKDAMGTRQETGILNAGNYAVGVGLRFTLKTNSKDGAKAIPETPEQEKNRRFQ